DLQYEPHAISGLAMYGALLGVYRGFNDGNVVIAAGDYYDWGFLLQAAYMLTDKLEVFGRYDLTRLDTSAWPAGTNQNISEITVGVNYYWHGQNAKFTVDMNWLPNGSPIPVPALNYLANQDNEVVFRAQFELNL